jgi:hypothetical protein
MCHEFKKQNSFERKSFVYDDSSFPEGLELTPGLMFLPHTKTLGWLLPGRRASSLSGL